MVVLTKPPAVRANTSARPLSHTANTKMIRMLYLYRKWESESKNPISHFAFLIISVPRNFDYSDFLCLSVCFYRPFLVASLFSAINHCAGSCRSCESHHSKHRRHVEVVAGSNGSISWRCRLLLINSRYSFRFRISAYCTASLATPLSINSRLLCYDPLAESMFYHIGRIITNITFTPAVSSCCGVFG